MLVRGQPLLVLVEELRRHFLSLSVLDSLVLDSVLRLYIAAAVYLDAILRQGLRSSSTNNNDDFLLNLGWNPVGGQLPLVSDCTGRL